MVSYGICIYIPDMDFMAAMETSLPRMESNFWKDPESTKKNPGWFFQSDYHEGATKSVYQRMTNKNMDLPISSPYLSEGVPNIQAVGSVYPSGKNQISAESQGCLFPSGHMESPSPVELCETQIGKIFRT